MIFFFRKLVALLTLCLYFPALAATQLQLVSTESDPDAFIQNCVNVINGNYCEAATDLVISGPDALVMQRFYHTNESITGHQRGGWSFFPQRFLIVGKDPSGKSSTVGKDLFEWTSAFTGERSGGILPYSGWRRPQGTTKDPLRIDVLNNTIGMVNTYAQEVNGQTNHHNNALHCKGDTCELILGDGTKRIYHKVQQLPTLLLGEELTPFIANQVREPDYFLLSQETLPSGNHLFFSYDTSGHLIAIEMKNKALTKTFSWVHFRYEFQKNGGQVHIETSDGRTLTYHLAVYNGIYQLTQVEGSHCIPVTYEYNDVLIKKRLPEGRFIEIDYSQGKVKSLKGPNAQSGKAEVICSFSYETGYTDVLDAMGVKTRYVYDNRLQLTGIERYDLQNRLYRIERKFWGKTKGEAGLLLATTIGDGNGRVHSYRTFQYDKAGNVTQEKLYGNLTGRHLAPLQVSPEGTLLNPNEEECHLKTFGYSTDGYNLLIKMGDCKGNQTRYIYQPGTNLLAKKLICDKDFIKKRTFHFNNNDGVCIKTIEDDGCEEESKSYSSITERHIKEIKPKETLPGVGLPEIIEEKALDLKTKQEVLIKKLVNTYDSQSNLLSCATYDANGQYAFTARKMYNLLGQVVSEVDVAGRETHMTYDGCGNLITTTLPHQGKSIATTFDFHNQPTEISEITNEGQHTITNTYDILGRKICSIDRYGNPTNYEYDAFHRLTKVIHPEVLDQNNQVVRPIFSYTYDLFGNVLTAKDPKGDVITKSYNLRGSPTKINYPDGSFELFKYDPEGSLHRSLTRDQIITVYEYDYLGRSIYEESSTANEEGVSGFLIGKSRHYNGFRCTYEKEDYFVKRYSFDPAGRLSTSTEYDYSKTAQDPDARKIEISYDARGRLCQRQVWFDCGPTDYSLECFEYDQSGNIVEKRIEDAQGAILLQRYFSYNSLDQCTEEYSLENGIKTSLIKTHYNSEGESIGYCNGLGQETKITIDHAYQNGLGQKVLKKTLTNPLGIQTEIEFDALCRISAIIKKDSLGVLLSSQKILYDSLGNKASEIHDQIVQGNIVGTCKMQWLYGPMGRLEEAVEGVGSPLEKRTCYRYNSLGQMISKSIPGEIPLNYRYGKEGHLLKIDAPDSKNELKIAHTYRFNKKGYVISARSICGNFIDRTCNVFNQIIEETVKDEKGTYTLKFAYDKKGRLKQITLPDNSKIAYTYDVLFGREVKRISAQGEVLYTHVYDQYDCQGKLLKETCIGYLGSKEYTYDLNGYKILSKNNLFSEQYVRDALGRLLEVKGNTHEEYAYNALSQLTLEKKIATKSHAYDSLDNRIKTDNDVLLYNALNQLTSYSNAEFSYDPHGNLLRKVLEGEETRFESNALSQLISIQKADKTSLLFSYDPLGRLLLEKHQDSKSKQSLSTTRHFYLGHQEIGTLTGTGDIETLKVPGLCGDELAITSIAFEIKGETYIPLHDVSGNVASIVDPQSGQIVESYRYTAFGDETIYNDLGEVEKSSEVGNPWRFAEKRIDQKSGLILFGLRFYDPGVGRWISQDPAGYLDGPNLYAYIHNNPLSHLDRFGLATETNSPTKFEGYFNGEVESHCHCEKHRTCKRGGDVGKTASTSLPKVTHDYFFERSYKSSRAKNPFRKVYYDDSTCYDLSLDDLPKPPKDLGVGFINGIWNEFEDAKESARYLSRMAGGYNIHGVYNATHGQDIDCFEYTVGLNYCATEPVRQLHKMWNSFFEKNSANAKFLMICHSQGAVHVRNALLDYSPELREKILVVAIAPAAYIYKETCSHVIHYRAEWWRDIFPRLDRAGARREKDTIVTLRSHSDAPYFDHTFMSPTYQGRLRWHITNYIQTQGKML